jgi:probable selenate reductase FAD-binding subunit
MMTEILRPETVEEAVRFKSRPGAAYLGGGTWLNSGAAQETTALISLEKLGLDAVHGTAESCVMGAALTLQGIVENAALPSAILEAAALTASRTLRNMVTLGGELGFCAEDSALIPVLMALDARITLAGRATPIALEGFCTERPDGLILSVTSRGSGAACAMRAVSRTSHSRKSLVVAVSAEAFAPVLLKARIIASDCCGRRSRLTDVEQTLESAPLPSKPRIEELVAISFSPQTDMHASSEYKRYSAGTIVADLLHSLAHRKAVS